jgi:energy-coupling factor transport system ATP-binding protein
MIKGEVRGRVEVDGCLTTACRPRELAARVGILLQDFEAQLFCTRVDQEVAFGPENLGLPREELVRRVRKSLAQVGLSGFEHREPATLSGGQKQLLALAAVLALEAPLLVLDEPTTDLDPQAVEDLMATLEHLSRTQDLTLVLLGEDLRLARNCSRIVLMEKGRIAADGPAEEVLRQVDLFRRLGLKAPELPALFYDLGQTRLPLTLEDAVTQAQELGWQIKPEDITRSGKEIPSPPPQPSPLKGEGVKGRNCFTAPGNKLIQRNTASEAQSGPAQFPSPSRGEGRGGGENGAPAVTLPLLELHDVTFAYPNSPPIFQNFSLSFAQGELTAILGPNGSGKTTLVKLLRGLLQPQAGEVRQAEHPLRVGFVFQNPDYQLFAEQVWEEVAFGPRQLGLDEEEVRRRVEIALDKVHLKDRAGEDPFSLTKGQRQRLAVAGVLALAPRVIILDEPTTGLDHRERIDLLDLIKELHGQGHTIIMVTHSMWAAAAYARRIIVLKDGWVVLDGPTRSVLAEEEILSQCRLKTPAVVQLSRRLGFMALTVEEFKRMVGKS